MPGTEELLVALLPLLRSSVLLSVLKLAFERLRRSLRKEGAIACVDQKGMVFVYQSFQVDGRF